MVSLGEVVRPLHVKLVGQDLQRVALLVGHDGLGRAAWLENSAARFERDAPLELSLELVETHLHLVVNRLNGNLLDLEEMAKVA